LAVVKMRGVDAFNTGQQQTWHGAATDDGERRSSVRSIDSHAAGLRLTLSQGWSRSGSYARVHKAAGAA